LTEEETREAGDAQQVGDLNLPLQLQVDYSYVD